jgi:DNA repair exonuclease SbcCD ATPase subunit
MKAGTISVEASLQTPPLCKRAGCYHPAIPVKGHRKKEYCSQACRQMDYRTRKVETIEQKIHTLEEKASNLQADSQRGAELEKRAYEAELRISEANRSIAKLEEKVRKLQAQTNFNEALREDTQVWYFKSWLRKRPQPKDSTFAKRFIADSRLPQHGSRALYEAKLRAYNYSAEDISLFRDLWLTLIVEQS